MPPSDHSPSEHLAVDFGIVLHAWGTLRAALQPKLFISAALATAILTFAAWKLQGVYHGWLAGAPDALRTPIDFGYTLVIDLCDSVVLAAVAVPVHRRVLLGETRDAPVALLSGRVWRSALWLVVFQMAAFVALLPLPLLMGASQVATVAIISAMAAFLIACFVAVLRLSLIFPAIATDVPAGGRLAEGWRLSRRHFWRLFVTGVFAMIPLLLAILLATLAGSAVVGSSGSLTGVFETLMWFEIVVTALSRPLTAALGAAVLAWNYSLASAELSEPA